MKVEHRRGRVKKRKMKNKTKNMKYREKDEDNEMKVGFDFRFETEFFKSILFYKRRKCFQQSEEQTICVIVTCQILT